MLQRIVVLAEDARRAMTRLAVEAKNTELLGLTPRLVNDNRVRSLESFVPTDWEAQLLTQFRSVAQGWHQFLGKAAADFAFTEVDVAEVGQYSFFTRVIHQKGRLLLALEGALRELRPDVLYVQADLYSAAKAVFSGEVRLLPGEALPKESLGLSRLLGLAGLGIAYKHGFTPLVSRFFQAWHGSRPQSGEPVFVGAEHGLKNLEAFFRSSGRPIRVFRPGGRLRTNQGLLSGDVDWRVTYMEGIGGLAAHFKALWRSLRSLPPLYQGLRKGLFKPAFTWRDRDCWSVFAGEFARFVLIYGPGAIKHRYLAAEVVRRWPPTKVFFDNPNSWDFSVMAAVFQHYGIPTSGYVNGMVQEIIPFRTCVDTMLVSGEYDRVLLTPHLDSKQTVTFGWAGGDFRRDKAENILLISSTTRHVEQRTEFLRTSLSFIRDHLNPASYREVVLKLHPYECREDLDPIIGEFPALKGRVRVVRANLREEIEGARLCFTLLSTVILDLLNAGVPFFLYDSPAWPRGTFYDEIPSEIRFTTPTQLATAVEHLAEVQPVFHRLHTKYYGSGGTVAQAVLERYLM